MSRVMRPLFKRHYEFVAIRRIRLGKDVYVEVGEKLEGFKLYHLRSLYNRRRIGPVGHPWTEQQLQSEGHPGLAPRTIEEAPAADIDSPLPLPIKDGSQWIIPGFGDAPKFTSKKKAQAWLDGLGTSTDNAAPTAAEVAVDDDEVSPAETDEDFLA